MFSLRDLVLKSGLLAVHFLLETLEDTLALHNAFIHDTGGPHDVVVPLQVSDECVLVGEAATTQGAHTGLWLPSPLVL